MRRFLVHVLLMLIAALSACATGHYVTVWTGPQVGSDRVFVVCTADSTGKVGHCL
jgi:hypothetical protein